MELIKYDAACRAVAEAKSLDDVKEIKNVCEAARAYAKMARNRDMEIDAIEIRVRAERKEGEILGELKKAGIGLQGNQRPDTKRITFKELGIDGNTSAIAQRLASLPHARFESELQIWRAKAPGATRLETPLQAYRVPSVRGDRQKAAVRLGRHSVRANDPLDRFRSPDGRRVADWRSGELKRIADLGMRMARCAEALAAAMPFANPDPLATVEMLFRQEELLRLLDGVWEIPINCGDAGLKQKRIDESRARRATQCEQCGAEFIKRHPSGKARSGKSNEGRFCSRECAGKSAGRQGAARKPNDHGTDKGENRSGG